MQSAINQLVQPTFKINQSQRYVKATYKGEKINTKTKKKKKKIVKCKQQIAEKRYPESELQNNQSQQQQQQQSTESNQTSEDKECSNRGPII